MSCKIVVERFTNPPTHAGDCLAAYDESRDLGTIVENQGGFNVLIIVSDADKDNSFIRSLVEDDLTDSPFNKIRYLQPVEESDPFFSELLTHGRITVPLETLKQYIRER